MESIIAYHFVNSTLRDGRPIPANGEWLEHEGDVVLCASGLHASVDAFDALEYAPGSVLCMVECSGEVIRGEDKLVCSRRRIIARFDAEQLLWEFSRKQALSVVHLWDAPKVVVEFLETGNEDLRAAARDAARDAAWAAARDAARDAARYAAWYAAWAAAWAAARGEAWSAARYAARDEAWGAARDAVWAAARAATWDAARKSFNDAVKAKFDELLGVKS